mgnify:FL=1
MKENLKTFTIGAIGFLSLAFIILIILYISIKIGSYLQGPDGNNFIYAPIGISAIIGSIGCLILIWKIGKFLRNLMEKLPK